MRRFARRASKAVFAALDVFARPLTGPRILIYHQIGGGSGLEMEVDPDHFRRHLDWLSMHLPVLDLESALREPKTASVVLTFDDGYRSLYDLAFPLLKERSMPFTLYLTTAPVESGQPMRGHAGADPLTWEMIREMRDTTLLTIGAHTHTHEDVRKLRPEDLERELRMSDELIQTRLGLQVLHFAYPWGYWSQDADRLVREKYETGALGSRLPYQTMTDDHLIHRIPVLLSDGERWFESRVRRGLLFEELIRRRLRGYSGL